MIGFKKKLWIGLLILTIVSPIGIILPMKFNAEDAWGEWSAETIQKLVGFIPEGMKRDAEIWKAPIPDYNLGMENSKFSLQAFSYIFSGLLGAALVAFVMYVIKKIIIKNEK
jgi:cobalt/nickel transport protein